MLDKILKTPISLGKKPVNLKLWLIIGGVLVAQSLIALVVAQVVFNRQFTAELRSGAWSGRLGFTMPSLNANPAALRSGLTANGSGDVLQQLANAVLHGSTVIDAYSQDLEVGNLTQYTLRQEIVPPRFSR